MNIFLPSNGIVGIKTVDMSPPKIKHLRQISELSKINEFAKNEFLSLLLNNFADLNKITIFDRDYLFLMAVSAIHLNNMEFTFTCKCGIENKGSFNIEQKDVIFFEGERILKKKIKDKEYVFNILTVGDEREIIEYALENEEKYHERFELALVAKTLGMFPHAMDEVEDLPLNIFYAALFFQQCVMHGIEPMHRTTCSCGNSTVVVIPVMDYLTEINTAGIMTKFAGLANKLDFKSFNEMTIPEVESFANIK